MVANDPKIHRCSASPIRRTRRSYTPELEVDNQLSFVQSYRRTSSHLPHRANGTAYKSNFLSGKEGSGRGLVVRHILAAGGPVWLGPHPGPSRWNHPAANPSCGRSITDKASGRSWGSSWWTSSAVHRRLLQANLGGRDTIGLLDAGGVVCGIRGPTAGGAGGPPARAGRLQLRYSRAWRERLEHHG